MLRIARAPQAKPAATASAAVAAVAAAVAAAQPDAPPVGAGRAHEQDDRGGPARIDTGESLVVLPLVRAAVTAAVSLGAADARTAHSRHHVLTPPRWPCRLCRPRRREAPAAPPSGPVASGWAWGPSADPVVAVLYGIGIWGDPTAILVCVIFLCWNSAAAISVVQMPMP